MKVSKRLPRYVFVLFIMCAITVFSYGDTVVIVDNSPQCTDLMAGQYIDSGDVCVEVTGDNLVVTYTTQDGWELNAVHLWVGDNLGDMPHNAAENPMIGNFPYKAEELGGVTSYSFTIPLTALGGPDYNTALCDETFYVAAHAEVIKEIPDEDPQEETGWGAGDPINPGGSWAMYFDFLFKCVTNGECPPPPTVPPGDCDTPIGG